MIKDFRHKGLKRLFERGDGAKVQPEHIERLRLLLFALDAAKVIDDMNQIGFRLHALKGDLASHWAVRVNGNWRLTFRFIDGDAYVVDYQDYH